MLPRDGDGVDFREHRHGAAFWSCLGVEDVGFTVRYVEGLHAVWVLGKQVADVGGGLMGGGDGEHSNVQWLRFAVGAAEMIIGLEPSCDLSGCREIWR